MPLIMGHLRRCVLGWGCLGGVSRKALGRATRVIEELRRREVYWGRLWRWKLLEFQLRRGRE